MALTVKAQHSEMMDDVELGVAGAFVVPNNGSVELTEEQERDFISMQRMTVSDALANSSIFTVEGDPHFSSISDVFTDGEVQAIEEARQDRAAMGLKVEGENNVLSSEEAAEVLQVPDGDFQNEGTVSANQLSMEGGEQ